MQESKRHIEVLRERDGEIYRERIPTKDAQLMHPVAMWRMWEEGTKKGKQQETVRDTEKLGESDEEIY